VPRGVLGGLADYAPRPMAFAIDVEGGQAAHRAGASGEQSSHNDRRIHGACITGSALQLRCGVSQGLRHRRVSQALSGPSNKSVYAAGGSRCASSPSAILTFGIVICWLNLLRTARIMAAQGAAALFVPTNNGMPPTRGGPETARGSKVQGHRSGGGKTACRSCVRMWSGEPVISCPTDHPGLSAEVGPYSERRRRSRPAWLLRTSRPHHASRGRGGTPRGILLWRVNYAQLVARAFAITEHSTDVTKIGLTSRWRPTA